MGVPVVTKTAPAPIARPSEREVMSTAPLPYRGAYPETKPSKYAGEVRGIVPGYGGHVPRAAETYGVSAMGNISKDKSPEKSRVSMSRHPDTKAPTVIPNPPAYNAMVNGIVPGYAGYVPKSAFTCGKSHVGGTSPFMTSPTSPATRQSRVSGNDEFLEKLRVAEEADAEVVPWTDTMKSFARLTNTTMEKNELEQEGNWWPAPGAEPSVPSFRESVGGVVPGYGGHVPRGLYKVGTTPIGRVAKGNNTQWETLGMAGHPDTKGSPAYEPHERIDAGPVLPGYSGYVPNSREKVGGSFYWTEDARKFAGKVAGESTEDNDRQNAVSMGLDDFGAVGFDESGNPLDT